MGEVIGTIYGLYAVQELAIRKGDLFIWAFCYKKLPTGSSEYAYSKSTDPYELRRLGEEIQHLVLVMTGIEMDDHDTLEMLIPEGAHHTEMK